MIQNMKKEFQIVLLLLYKNYYLYHLIFMRIIKIKQIMKKKVLKNKI